RLIKHKTLNSVVLTYLHFQVHVHVNQTRQYSLSAEIDKFFVPARSPETFFDCGNFVAFDNDRYLRLCVIRLSIDKPAAMNNRFLGRSRKYGESKKCRCK